jgi:hypothetical protein
MSAPRRTPGSRAWLAVAVLLILVLSPCVGLGGGVAYLAAHREGAFTRWRSLGSPPGGAASLVAGDTTVIYAAAADGNVYSCPPTSQARDACWSLAAEPFTVDSRADYEHSVIPGEAPPPPQTPVEVLYVSRFYAEMAVEARYARLPNGTVWVWFHESSGYLSLLVLMGAPALGFVLGVVLAIVLLIAQGVRRRPTPAA